MNKKSLLIALGATLSLGMAGAAQAGQFQAEKLDSGYNNAKGSFQLACAKKGDGKCGAGKCGANKMKKKSDGKCGAGKCGANKMEKKSHGKCGAGKCGAKKMEKKSDTAES